MAVNINGAAPAYVGSRSLCATSTGRLWQALVVGTTLAMWYSDDSGGTWSENTSARITSVDAVGPALYIDADDHAHILYSDGSLFGVYYARMASISTTSAWSSPSTIEYTGSEYHKPIQIVAHREGTGWVAHAITHKYVGGAETVRYRNIPIAANGTIGTINYTDLDSVTAGTFISPAGIDFHHTAADVTAIQGSAPHLYAAWGKGTSLYFAKAAYSAGTWTWGATRTLGSGLVSGSPPISSIIFDGTRAVVAALVGYTTPSVKLWERDAADTTTTARAITSVTIESPNVTYDANGDVWVIGEDTTGAGGTVRYKVYDRSADTWGTETVLESEAAAGSTDVVSVRRGGGFDMDVSWGEASSARFERTIAPHPPTAATWVSPVDFAGADVGAALVLDWDFQDPYPSDTQSAYAVSRQIGSGTVYYWRASDSTWQTAEVKNVSATTALTLASSWGSDGDANHKYAVKTWDSADAEGTYSATLTVVPSTPDLPTITTPTDAASWVTSSITVVWTVATQTTYLVELLNAAGTTVLWSSGTLTSTSTRSCAVAYTLANGVDYKVRVTTANDEGLVGTADTNSFSVSYTAPATPTLTVTANTPTGAITVEHTNPTPTGSQPTVTSVDVYVRCTAGTYADGERPVGGAGIRVKTGLTPGVDWIDYAPASGRAYQYLVRAYGDNGTTGDSAWTS